jgi:hypothetical protein
MADKENLDKRVLNMVFIAQPILDKIKTNPKLAYVHDPMLSRLHEPRQNKYFIMNTLTEIMEMYEAEDVDNMPEQAKAFVKEANNFIYRGSN